MCVCDAHTIAVVGSDVYGQFLNGYFNIYIYRIFITMYVLQT